MKAHITLNQTDEAKKEIEEVEKKIDGTEGLTRRILEHCVVKLKEILPAG